jgi:hypothetical protein
LRRWDVATGAERAVIHGNPNGEVHHTVFSADGRYLATVIHDGTLHLWDVEAGTEVRTWKVPAWESTTIRDDGNGRKKVTKSIHPAITDPVFSPDSKVLLAAEGPQIHRWETATGQRLPPFVVEGTSRGTTWCQVSPDGRTLVVRSWGRRRQVVLLDAASGKVKQRMEGMSQWTHQAAFSSDGRTLAVDQGDEVLLWEVASGRSRGRLKSVRMTFSLAFSPDGRFLAVGSDPGPLVSLWDLASGRVVGRLHDDRGRVQQLAFSPDGSRLAVAGYFPTVLVVDVADLCHIQEAESGKRITAVAEELEGLWEELCSADDARAYRAIRRLGSSGPRGAAFLKSQLQGENRLDEQRIRRLIAQLDDNDFTTREKASAELAKLGRRAERALRQALEQEDSAELRRRVKRLLERLSTPAGPPPSPERVRLRAIEALEANASSEARKALAELAKGPTEAVLTAEAKASLERLARRAVSRP